MFNVLALLIGPWHDHVTNCNLYTIFLIHGFLVLLVVESVKGKDMLHSLLIYVIVYACHPHVYDRAERCSNKVKIYQTTHHYGLMDLM